MGWAWCCVCCQAHGGLIFWFILLRYSVVCVLLSHYLSFNSFLYLDLYVLGDNTSIYWESFMRTKHLKVLIHIRIKGEVGTENWFKPPSNILTDRSYEVLLFRIFVLWYCLVCVMQPWDHLLGQGWLLGSPECDIFLAFVTFPYGILGQVWYLIVSIPDLCLLPYF